MAEAFAEYLHKRIRGEFGFAAEGPATPRRCARKAITAAVTRSATPPHLDDQRQLSV
jgi:cobalamin-dependent methionine synthase I